MTIERQTKKLYGLINQTETVPVGRENLIIVPPQGPEGQMVIRVIKVLSPDKVVVTDFVKNPNAKELKDLYVQIQTREYTGQEINAANLHSSSDFSGRLFGTEKWCWKP